MTRVESFERITRKMLDTYKAKNSDYGGSFAALRNRFPESIVIRLWDKLSRLEQLMKPGYEMQVEDEKIEDTLIDLANYSVMELVEREMAVQDEVDSSPRSEQTNDVSYETIWSLGADGVTERYNMAGGFNDLELYKRSDGLGFELWMNSMIAFANDDEIVRHLDNLETALWKYTYASEPDNKYEIQWDDMTEFGDTIKGKTITEVATKFSFYVDAFVRHVREKDHA